MLYYRLAEHINKYMSVVQYIVGTLSTRVGIQLCTDYVSGYDAPCTYSNRLQ